MGVYYSLRDHQSKLEQIKNKNTRYQKEDPYMILMEKKHVSSELAA